MSTRFKRRDARTTGVFALAFLLPCAAMAAAPTTTQPPAAETRAAPPAAQPKVSAKPGGKPGDDQLNEVTISAEKPTHKVADLIPFLRRILGQYTVDGKVDLGGQGKPEERWTAVGTGSCVGFGVAPGVQCELNVKWPQIPGPNGEAVMSGILGMEPLMILYGLEPDELGIRYLQVNNRGLAEGATGYMLNDTVTFKTPCVNTTLNCQRVTRVTARSESKVVDLQIDTEIDSQVAARFNFKLRRVGNAQAELVTPAKESIATKPAITNKAPGTAK